jgi:muramoyltetrapeptide carboxypeptidase
MSSKTWLGLQPGDIVDVVAPAGKPKPHTISGIESFLRAWGLKARVPQGILQKDLLCANSKKNRWKFLKQALMAKDSKMIWCVRGGYGSLHLLEDLKKIKAQKPKIFLGYSDITSLHTFLNQNWGWATLHGPNIDRFALRTGTRSEAERIRKVVFGKTDQVQFRLKALNKAAQKNHRLRSSVTGGNLITLQSSFGTPFSVKTKNKILFLEDIGERAYRIDRVLEQMRQLGLFKDLKALVLGQFTDGLEPNGKNILPTYFKQFAAEQSFPVLSGVPSGHGKNQHPLPLNTKSELVLGKKATLTIGSGVQSLV